MKVLPLKLLKISSSSLPHTFLRASFFEERRATECELFIFVSSVADMKFDALLSENEDCCKFQHKERLSLPPNKGCVLFLPRVFRNKTDNKEMKLED